MIRAALLALTLVPAAVLPAAGDPVFSAPIACDLGSNCFIQQYVDHDPGKGARDFRCAPLTYDGHKGTDFALRTHNQMRAGVDVIAAAPGTIKATRDGVADRLYSDANAEYVSGRECGNGVVIDHGDGWETQYCHLRKGTIAVRKGAQVKTGTRLGEVGLSGRTQFPHVHMGVRKNGQVIDPFDPDGELTCGTPDANTLWAEPLPYRPGGVLTVGFSDGIPSFDDVRSGRAAESSLSADAPAVVIYGFAFGGQEGDEMRLVLRGPGGVIVDQTETLPKDQAQFFRAVGKRLPGEGWPRGTYAGTVTLSREGRTVNSQSSEIRVR